METSKLEVYITQKDAGRGVYISFPTTRQALRRAFKKAHIPLNDWKIAALKTGSDVFSEAVLACRNLDELNLLGFWLSQLSEKQYDAFFRLCDAGCAEGNRMADLINLAANYHNVFCWEGIADETALGKRCIERMIEAKPEDAEAIREEFSGLETELGIEYAAMQHGHIYDNVYCARKTAWEDVYDEECPETIPEELRLSPTTTKEALGCLPVLGENA